MNELHDTLVIQPTIFFDMEPGETLEEAEQRVYNILQGDGLNVATINSYVRRLEKCEDESKK